jgi:hypothetical protein
MSTVRVCVILIFVAASAVTLVALPFVTGPVPGKTGGFGEMTCHECHWDKPVNEPSGRLTLLGMPATYTPDARYSIIIDLAHPELVLGGFQLSARFVSGSSAGTNAGALRPIDEFAQRVADDERRVIYVQHTKAGATPARPGAARWTLEWTAPAGETPVVFHAAGNASNGDASPLGDFIYTATALSGAAPDPVK